MNIINALTSLRPGEEWILDGESYEDLIWLSNTIKPTIEELEIASDQFEQNEINVALQKEKAKESALAKLQKLGLTEEEARAIAGL